MRSDDRSVVLDGSILPRRALIGGKAWSIARMRQLGLPVPPAFALTTEVCHDFHRRGGLPDDVDDRVLEGIAYLEAETGRTFGAGPHPLLVSVRSGAAVSMPGMMDTVLNLGMNDAVEAALAAEVGAAGYARDTHRRFCQQYAKIVLRTRLRGAAADASPADLRALVEKECGSTVPADPREQLWAAIAAVFESWESLRARVYRRHWDVPGGGTAVTVQAMVFGNLDDRSGTGVLFTRNPLAGEPRPYGEYLPRGQGEDVVSGEFDPERLDEMAMRLPDVHRQLLAAGETLEREAGDVQDIEFTVERGKLYLLQARTAKRSPEAAIRIALDLVREGTITPLQALRHITPVQVRAAMRPRLAEATRESARVLARGEAACPGVAAGRVVVEPDEAERQAGAGRAVVLARPTTSPDDVHGMIAARAVITELGGSTSHAAVVSRALGRPCVVGCGEGHLTPLEGQDVTVEGTTGEILEGILPTERNSEADDPQLRQLLEWAESESRLAVYSHVEDAPGEWVDLDAAGVDDPAQLAGHVAGARGARGRVLETDAGVHAAVAAGLEFVIVEDRLPALLASLPPSEPDPEATSPYL